MAVRETDSRRLGLPRSAVGPRNGRRPALVPGSPFRGTGCRPGRTNRHVYRHVARRPALRLRHPGRCPRQRRRGTRARPARDAGPGRGRDRRGARRRHARAPVRAGRDRGGRVRPAVRPADWDIEGHRLGGPDFARQHVQRRARRARTRRAHAHGAARLRARGRTCDVHGLPAPRRSGGHPQLGADRADQHVRRARGRADCHRGRVHPVRQGEVPQRRRRRGHPAQQGVRLLGRLQHRGHAAHAGRVCRAPQCRRRGVHRARAARRPT